MSKIIIMLIVLLAIITGGLYWIYPQLSIDPVSLTTNRSNEVVDTDTENKEMNVTNSGSTISTNNKTKKDSYTKNESEKSLQQLQNSIEDIIADSVQEEIQQAVESKIETENAK